MKVTPDDLVLIGQDDDRGWWRTKTRADCETHMSKMFRASLAARIHPQEGDWFVPHDQPDEHMTVREIFADGNAYSLSRPFIVDVGSRKGKKGIYRWRER